VCHLSHDLGWQHLQISMFVRGLALDLSRHSTELRWIMAEVVGMGSAAADSFSEGADMPSSAAAAVEFAVRSIAARYEELAHLRGAEALRAVVAGANGFFDMAPERQAVLLALIPIVSALPPAHAAALLSLGRRLAGAAEGATAAAPDSPAPAVRPATDAGPVHGAA
jgi:hypothetical protein